MQLLVVSVGYETPLLASKIVTKALICLPHNIINDFYKATKKSSFVGGSVNLLVLERWLDSCVQNYFNPLGNTWQVMKSKRQIRKEITS